VRLAAQRGIHPVADVEKDLALQPVVRGQIVEQPRSGQSQRLDVRGRPCGEQDDGDVVQVAQIVPEARVEVERRGCDDLEPRRKQVCIE